MSDLYWETKKEIDTFAKNLKIDDHNTIREMVNEKMKEKMTGMMKQVIDTLSMTGIGDITQGSVTEALRTTHRYTQGEFWGTMLKVIKAYGEQEHFDARNKWAVDMCKRMAMAGEDPRTEEILKQHIKDTTYVYSSGQ